MPLTESDTVVVRPRDIFRPDALLGWSLTPDAEIHVAFRDPPFTQRIGSDGWRRVPGAPDIGRDGSSRAVTVHGCSYTFGTGLTDDETYCALLQSRFPDVIVRNRGVGGHSTVQAFLRFREEVRLGATRLGIVGIISDHRYRNRPHPRRMHAFNDPAWSRAGIEHVPQAVRRGDGRLEVVPVPCWQPAARAGGIDAFLPDEHDLTRLLIEVLQMIVELSLRSGVPVLPVLLDASDPEFNRAVLDAVPGVVDASPPHEPGFTLEPYDSHPNAAANRVFAERISPFLADAIGA